MIDHVLVAVPPGPLREFWSHFRENAGAVAGLAVIVRRSASPPQFSTPPLAGELPSPLDPPSGCAFHTRCPFASVECRQIRPELRPLAGRWVACHHAERLD